VKLARPIRKLLKLPLTLPLQISFVRRRVAFELKYRWFRDLEIAIPLSNGFYCPISVIDSVHSFSEIFVNNEYGSFLQKMPLPKRWIDLGCHAGYFTLYLAWRNAVNGRCDWRALLIDADPRMKEITDATIRLNGLEPYCVLLWGLISKERGEREFALRAGMGSSGDLSVGDASEVRRVRSIPPEEMMTLFAPPYDLVKVDIEGAEYDFLEGYSKVYSNTSWILIEWHSSDRDGSGQERVMRVLEAQGFHLMGTVRGKRECELDGRWFSSGVQLYRSKRLAG
jgi:FkbM family methyltransferase